MINDDDDVKELEIESIIGFDGNILRGFHVHPDGQHVVYALGNKVSIQHWYTKKQYFLSGHTNTISALDLSSSGKLIASGQINHIGFKAQVILWNFHDRTIMSSYELHKVRVEAVIFSINDTFLISLGGRDCGSVIVWDIELGQPLCGNSASKGIQGEATVLRCTNRRSACFLTAGDGTLIVWKIDRDSRNVKGVDVSLSKLKRIIMCMDLNERDELCYCGTSTGDVLKIRLNFHHDLEVLDPAKKPMMAGCFAKVSRKKLPDGVVDLYSQGVRSILLTDRGDIVVGAGDGTLDLVTEAGAKTKEPSSCVLKVPSTPELFVLKTTNVKAAVTSLVMFEDKRYLLAGTVICELYMIHLESFETVLMLTSHTSTIHSIAFPHKFSDVFATGSKNDVRLWSTKTPQELLRICVPNFACTSVVFAHDGKAIITGWNDGIIRSFTPLTGRLMWAITNAHNKGVSAIAITHHGRMLISGGCEGQVRLWSISPYRQDLDGTLKEHKGPVSAIRVNSTDDEAVSASTDGTCIIWDLVRKIRRQLLFGNTLFMCVQYYPSGVQVITGGSDRKIAYWEIFDGSLVRELEGSKSGAINWLDISYDGDLFVTGGNDEVVKLWKYCEGVTTHIGLGHSAVITSVCFSPNGKNIVSASAAGSIFIWKIPEISKNKEEITSDTSRGSTFSERNIRTEKGTPKRFDKGKEESIENIDTSRSAHSDFSTCKCVSRICRCVKPKTFSQNFRKTPKSP